jgi:hypothetical protein
MMAKKPSARYQSGRELLEDIARLREALGGTTTSMSAADRTEPELADLDEPPAAVPLWKQPAVRWIAVVLAVVMVLTALMAGIGIGLRNLPNGKDGPRTAVPPGPDGGKGKPQPGEGPKKDRETTLKEAADQHLREKSSNPAGTDACIELGVLYLDQNRIAEAEALFKRMDERRAPSPDHYLGQLGLAIVEALQKKYRTSHNRITSQFDPKKTDNRAQILNQYLTKHPDFAKWVSGADAENVRNGAAQSSLPQKLKLKSGKWPFGKKS